VADRHREFDMPHALAPDTGEGDFNTAAVADHAAMLDALVFAARALPVLDGTEDALAEQAALFRLESAVVDGLGILDLALGPSTHGLRAGDGDADVINQVDLVQAEQFAGGIFGANHSCWVRGLLR